MNQSSSQSSSTHETALVSSLVLAPGAFLVDAQGLVVIGEPSFDVWSGAVEQARTLRLTMAFFVGDLLNYGSEAYGEMASQIIDAEKWDADTALGYAWLAERIPRERRRMALFPKGCVGFHQAVARLEPDQQVEWLEKAADAQWSVKELRQELHAAGLSKPHAEPAAVETACWLWVKCAHEMERQGLRDRLMLEGWICGVQEP